MLECDGANRLRRPKRRYTKISDHPFANVAASWRRRAGVVRIRILQLYFVVVAVEWEDCNRPNAHVADLFERCVGSAEASIDIGIGDSFEQFVRKAVVGGVCQLSIGRSWTPGDLAPQHVLKGFDCVIHVPDIAEVHGEMISTKDKRGKIVRRVARTLIEASVDLIRQEHMIDVSKASAVCLSCRMNDGQNVVFAQWHARGAGKNRLR